MAPAAIYDTAGPPAVHGVVRWRLIDLAPWLFEAFRLVVSKQPLRREPRNMGTRQARAARTLGPPSKPLHPIPLRRATAITSTAIQTEKALTNGKRAKTGGAIVCGRPPSSTPSAPSGSSAKTRP
jgi:hypothetical protein